MSKWVGIFAQITFSFFSCSLSLQKSLFVNIQQEKKEVWTNRNQNIFLSLKVPKTKLSWLEFECIIVVATVFKIFEFYFLNLFRVKFSPWPIYFLWTHSRIFLENFTSKLCRIYYVNSGQTLRCVPNFGSFEYNVILTWWIWTTRVNIWILWNKIKLINASDKSSVARLQEFFFWGGVSR